jgi:hypothetical protein
MGNKEVQALQKKAEKQTVKQWFGIVNRAIYNLEKRLLDDPCDDKDRQLHDNIRDLRMGFADQYQDWDHYRKDNPKDKYMDNSNPENEY